MARLAVILGAAAMIAASIFVAVSAQTHHWPYWLLIDLVCLLVAVASLTAMLHIARIKTDGEWRWRWRS